MSSIVARYMELPDAMAAGCDRLVQPSVKDENERQRQSRFIGVMLSAPFFVAGGAVILVTAGMGAAVTVAAIFAAFGLCWFAALLVAATGQMKWAGPMALVAASPVLAALVVAAGGLASPAALLLLALPAEANWIGASRRSAVWGAAVALIGALLVQIFAGTAFFAGQEVATWHWLLPLAWALTWVPRFAGLRDMTSLRDDSETEPRLEDMMDAVVLRVARQGEVLDASEKARSILNLAPELLINSGLFDRVHLADRVSYLSALADMREGALLRKLDLRVRLPQAGSGAIMGNYRRFSLEFVRAQNQIDVFTAILREGDVVADLREELDAANEAAASAELAKGRFLAAVSHELRTPLNAILGFSDMLLHEMFGPFGDPRQKEYVGLVRDSGQHLLEVVTSILDVSKIESGAYTTEPKPFRFADAVDMCGSMMRLQAEAKQIRMQTRIGPDIGEVNADRRAVQQILINLVSNAIKFTPDGGEVVVDAKRIGSRLHFWVSDTGIGIAEENLGKLGRPFTQIQNDYTRHFEGTGLGLSLVKGLVALHEGTMSVESAPGEGTKVTISLPVEGPGQGADKPVVLPMPLLGTMTKEDGHAPLRKTA